MGNCLRHQSQMLWAGDDWGSTDSEEIYNDREEEEEKKKNEMGDEKKVVSSSSASREVKIKISKKQLEELLGKFDVQGSSIEQVLAQLMTVSDEYSLKHRSWRPNLRSIPEVN